MSSSALMAIRQNILARSYYPIQMQYIFNAFQYDVVTFLEKCSVFSLGVGWDGGLRRGEVCRSCAPSSEINTSFIHCRPLLVEFPIWERIQVGQLLPPPGMQMKGNSLRLH